MKFDVIIGNPPYQMATGTTTAQATPLYNYFVENAIKMNPKYLAFIIPARWYAGGMGLDNFRSVMLNDRRIKKMVDYPNAKECFPNNSIGGGVCYFLWDRDYNGDCDFTNVINGRKIISSNRKLNEFDVFIRYNNAVNIIHKIQKKSTDYLSNISSSLSPFGIDSSERGFENKGTNDLILYSSGGKSYFNSKSLSKGLDYLANYHVMISKVTSEHAGEPASDGKFTVISTMRILNPNEICTFSYFLIGDFKTEIEAINCNKFLLTRFSRFLLLQSVSSINLSKEKFKFIPLENFTEKSDIDWTKNIEDIESQLYKKYDINESEIEFINSMIKPKGGM